VTDRHTGDIEMQGKKLYCLGPYSDNSCTNAIMENLMVIRVEVIAPEKPLDVNTSSKNIIHVDFIICKRPKISSVLIWSVAIAKNTYVDLGLSVRTQNSHPRLNPRCTLALSLPSPSLPISQYLALSFCVICP